jgi:DNA-binding CsgD family transcriptional regulator
VKQDRLSLTPREVSILELIADGLTNPEIGAMLFISTETVKTHAGRAYAKLGANGRVNAVALACRRGILRRYRVVPFPGSRA